jgi:hypothetical protein
LEKVDEKNEKEEVGDEKGRKGREEKKEDWSHQIDWSQNVVSPNCF